jgi:hypothetical protein
MKKTLLRDGPSGVFAIGELGLSLDSIAAKMRSLAHGQDAAAGKINLLDLRTTATPCESSGIRA